MSVCQVVVCEYSQNFECFLFLVTSFRRIYVVGRKFYAVMCEQSQNLEVSFWVVAKFRGLRVVATR